MRNLAEDILEEVEFKAPEAAGQDAWAELPATKIEAALEILNPKSNANAGRRACLSFSGGSDSLVALDLAHKAGLRPVVIWVDTGMEYPDTEAFVFRTAVDKYCLDLRVARHELTPLGQWQKTGWPFLGKLAARRWMQLNQDAGFKINVSECCRARKIRPARAMARNAGCALQITGQRGSTDDLIRSLRAHQDGPVHFQVESRLWIVNPITGWTDADVRAYITAYGLEEHPAKARGAATIGCVFCGGGSQYTNSGFRVLRKTWPEAWKQFVVDWRGGYITLALKYGANLENTIQAVTEAGGLEALARTRPWIFDYTRRTPINGYKK
jgi:phosphoadenosine phosphosulfate reductase